MPDAPRVGCATDGIATDVYCLDGGYGYNLKHTRRLLHCVRNDSKGGLEAIGKINGLCVIARNAATRQSPDKIHYRGPSVRPSYSPATLVQRLFFGFS